MSAGDIAFPNLGIYLENVPRYFTVFGFEITFYGLIIGIGIIAGILTAAGLAKRTGLDPEVVWDFAIYAVLFSIIGARIYYVVFAWDYYKGNLPGIFNIRKGGLAIYGGVIAAFITLFVYSGIKRQKPFRIGDVCVPGLILGQAIGRWGNFMNREVFGEYYDGLLSMQLPTEAVRARDISENIAAHMPEGADYIQVHPTFLYESIWCLVIFALMLFYMRYRKFDGEICLFYFAGYGLGRFVIEGIRTDTLFIPGTTVAVSQVLSLLMLLFAVITDVIVRIRMKRKETETKI